MLDYDTIKQRLIDASDAYYNKSESILTDEEFDALRDEFVRRFPDDPFLKTIGAPVIVTKWKKFTHTMPMCSCNKVTNPEEFDYWLRYHKIHEDILIASEKLDGMSIGIYFQKGILTTAATRGDGTIGEDITPNIIKMGNVKTKLSTNFTGALRGEVIMTTQAFEAINRELQSRGEKQFTSMRNAASGIAKKFDSPFAKYLTVRYYYVDGMDFTTKTEMFNFIENVLNLKTSPHFTGTRLQICKLYDQYEAGKRAALEYEIDGLVIEIDNIALFKAMGTLNDNFRGQIAYKFGPIKKETKIVNIEWSMGNSRRITPVAIVEPVYLVGATVTRASLHNVEIFNSMELCKGDTIQIARSGDVIPYIYQNLSKDKKTRGNRFSIPTTCPVCGGVTKVDGKFLVCTSPTCSGSIQGDVRKWIKELGLLGIADKTVEKLYEAGFKTPSSLYTVTLNDAMKLEHFGESSAQKLIDTLKAKKKLTLPEMVGGLNIPDVGTTTIENLEKEGYDTITSLMGATVEELTNVKGIGISTATAIVNGLKNKYSEIKSLLDVGITIRKREFIMSKKVEGGKLNGKSFCFTGAIQHEENGKRMTRDRMWELVRENGGIVEESVRSGLNFLVMANPDSTSSKTVKAKKLGVSLLSEADFFKMIG